MTALDAFRSALSAIAANKLRSALTMLGIVIGVMAVIVMVAVGTGAREAVVGQIRSLGSNLIVVQSGNVTQGGVRLGSGASSTLTDEDATAISREVPGVVASAPIVRQNAQILAGGSNWASAVQGIDLDFPVARDWEIDSGRMFDGEEIRRGDLVAILGQTVARSLFADLDPVGQEIRVRNVPLRVIGTMAGKGQNMMGQDQDDIVLVPLNTARQRVLGRNFAKSRSVQILLVKFEDGADQAEGTTRMRELLRQRHRLPDDQEDDFSTRNLTEIMNTLSTSARTLSLLLAAVAAVSLLVGGIGIMNIMLVSVTERTREIGLRLAVGAKPSDIRSQFLIEATTLSLLGGFIGIALGTAAARIIATTAGWPALVSLEAVLMAAGFSAMIGIFFGFYPAQQAARLDPIEALRRA